MIPGGDAVSRKSMVFSSGLKATHRFSLTYQHPQRGALHGSVTGFNWHPFEGASIGGGSFKYFFGN